MANYHDEILTSYISGQNIDYEIISDTSFYIEMMNRLFPFSNGRIDFSVLNNQKFICSNQNSISYDTINLLKSLIKENLCSENETVIYIGDSLTENGYEFHIRDLMKVLPFLLYEIPQHHYILFNYYKRILFVSFENEVEFGEVLT